MTDSSIIDSLCADGVIAVVRLSDASHIVRLAESLLAGGVRGIEVTLTTSGAESALRVLSREAPRCLIGAGSVLTETQARAAIDSGAQYLVSPVFSEPVLEVGRARNIPVVPAAFTPTEIWRAVEHGARLIKLFPAARLGPAFIRDVLAPIPGLRLMPTGGISLDNTADWIRAGAAAVGVGTALVDPKLIAEGRFDELTARAQGFVERVAQARR